jgi:hypothetical protein
MGHAVRMREEKSVEYFDGETRRKDAKCKYYL